MERYSCGKPDCFFCYEMSRSKEQRNLKIMTRYQRRKENTFKLIIRQYNKTA